MLVLAVGWSLAVLSAMVITAGGLADLILKSDDQGTLLPFSRGHLVSIGGAAMGVVGMMFTETLLTDSCYSVIPWTGVAVSAAAYLLALNAQRRGNPTVWEGLIGLVVIHLCSGPCGCCGEYNTFHRSRLSDFSRASSCSLVGSLISLMVGKGVRSANIEYSCAIIVHRLVAFEDSSSICLLQLIEEHKVCP